VSPEIDRATRLGRVRVTLPASAVARVGAFARAEIEVRRDVSITAPASALIYGPDGPTVLVAHGGQVHARKVSLGLVDGARAELRGGVQEGEDIVVRAGAFLRNGDAVRPVPAATAERSR
jgi:HlyD family secretion protein